MSDNLRESISAASEGHVHDRDATADNATYAVFNHLAGLLSLISGGIPFASLIATLIMWRMKKDESPFLDDHGREAVNFQLSLMLYWAVGAVVGTVFAIVTLGLGSALLPVGGLLLIALNLIGSIRGARAAGRREYYRYPMNIRFIANPPAD